MALNLGRAATLFVLLTGCGPRIYSHFDGGKVVVPARDDCVGDVSEAGRVRGSWLPGHVIPRFTEGAWYVHCSIDAQVGLDAVLMAPVATADATPDRWAEDFAPEGENYSALGPTRRSASTLSGRPATEERQAVLFWVPSERVLRWTYEGDRLYYAVAVVPDGTDTRSADVAMRWLDGVRFPDLERN